MTFKKRVLIAGGTGFIGYHLAKYLVSKRYDVTSLSFKKPLKTRKCKGIKYIFINILNKKKLNSIKNKFDFVINLSGYVDHSNKKMTYKTHYQGCINLYNKFKYSRLKKFIQIGSSLEYGKLSSPQEEKYNKKTILKSIYSRSKFLATNFLLKKFKQSKFPVVIIRAYQVYGPSQDLDRLVPFVITKCLQNKKFDCSSGKQQRDFLYVDDFVKAIYKALKKNVVGEIINIGFGKPIFVKSIIKKIQSIIKKGKPVYGKISLRKDENMILYPSIKKAHKILNWKPKVKLDKGIKKTINYYKNIK
jgi:nucleoside-diphosphate-sugar epimerase